MSSPTTAMLGLILTAPYIFNLIHHEQALPMLYISILWFSLAKVGPLQASVAIGVCYRENYCLWPCFSYN